MTPRTPPTSAEPTSAMPILRNAISRNSKARGVIATARMSRPGASTAKTSVNWGVDIKSAHSGATANVASDSTAPIYEVHRDDRARKIFLQPTTLDQGA